MEVADHLPHPDPNYKWPFIIAKEFEINLNDRKDETLQCGGGEVSPRTGCDVIIIIIIAKYTEEYCPQFRKGSACGSIVLGAALSFCTPHPL